MKITWGQCPHVPKENVGLGLAKLVVTNKKLRAYKLEVIFHSKRD